MVSAATLIFAVVSSLAALLIVPVLIFWNAARYPGSSRFYTAIPLLLWVCASIVHAGVWFLIVVAAHSVGSSELYVWIAANAIYPVIGAAIVLSHRWLMLRSFS